MIQIGGRIYELLHEHKNAWNADAFKDRYNEVLDRYDYIVGDWGYNMLRLKGFFRENHPKATKESTIAAISDYINEYCNFGCAYFVLQKTPANKRHGDFRDQTAAGREAADLAEQQKGLGDGQPLLERQDRQEAALSAEPNGKEELTIGVAAPGIEGKDEQGEGIRLSVLGLDEPESKPHWQTLPPNRYSRHPQPPKPERPERPERLERSDAQGQQRQGGQRASNNKPNRSQQGRGADGRPEGRPDRGPQGNREDRRGPQGGRAERQNRPQQGGGGPDSQRGRQQGERAERPQGGRAGNAGLRRCVRGSRARRRSAGTRPPPQRCTARSSRRAG